MHRVVCGRCGHSKDLPPFYPVLLFQDGKDGPKSDHLEEVPQILVGSTTLINTSLTLTASMHIVIFDSECLNRDEQQAIARVSRIGQDTETETIKCVNALSKLDVAIKELLQK